MTDWNRIVKTFRKHMDMTQTELAEAIGTRQSTIVRWEGGAEPKVEGFRKLADYARSRNYNIEVPWESGQFAIKLIGIATEFGRVNRQPEDPEEPEIPLDLGFSTSTINEAIEIKGDGLMPRLHDGDLIGIVRIDGKIAQTEAGMLVISFKEGGLYLRQIGVPQEVDRPWINTDTGEKLTVEWAGIVKLIIPRGGWRRRDRGVNWLAPAALVRKNNR